VANFRIVTTGKNPSTNCTKAFYGKRKLQKSPYFEQEKRSHVAIFRQLVSIKSWQVFGTCRIF
jgi:hypothetical protein